MPSPELKRPAAPPPAVAKPAEAGAGPRRTIEVVASSDAPLNPALEQAPATPEPEPEISQWTTMDAAMSDSRRSGKPVMIDFSADWCGPCRRLKEGVFDDWSRGRAVQGAVIPVSIVDRVRENGQNPPEIESLQRQYQIDAFPTLVVFSPATGRILTTHGFSDPDRTADWIKQAAQSVR